MKVIPPTYQEIAWKQCQKLLMLNPLMLPNYYGILFSAFKALLIQTHIDELNVKIEGFEEWMSDDLNTLKLSEIEIRMFNNLDLLSGFQVGADFRTQMEINQKLEEIKSWLTQLLYVYLPNIRFTQPIRFD